MAVSPEAHPGLHIPHIPKKVALGATAILAGIGTLGYALSRGGEPSTSTLPIPQTTGLDVPPAAGTGGGEPPPNPPELPVVVPPTPEPKTENKSAPITAEIKPYDNGIVSPEAYPTGDYIEWSVQGATVKGIGFIMNKGEKLRIPEDLQVATDEYPIPHTYTGRRIAGVSDGRRLTFIGAVSASDGLTDVGKNLSGGTVVGTINSSTPVLEGAKYNLVILSPEEERVKRFPDQTKNPPKKIDNTFTAPASGGLTLHDRKPPQ